MSSCLHLPTYLRGTPLEPLAPLDGPCDGEGMQTAQTQYKVFATKGLQFVSLARPSVHEAFVTAAKLRTLGWSVTVSR
jgi:hypothetical protein